MSEKREEFFHPLDADTNEVTEIESLCVSCMEQGTTKLMLTRIPFFRDVVVSSFDCPHCHFNNCELNSGLEIAEMGIEYKIDIRDALDLNRMIVKSDSASIAVPELDLEIPAKTQKGEVTTIEGILSRVVTGLKQDQLRRKEEHPDIYEQIETYIKKIEDCLALKTKVTVIVRDISGSSFIGNRADAGNVSEDPQLHCKKFSRTPAEDISLGIANPNATDAIQEEEEDEGEAGGGGDKGPTNFKEEVLQMPTNCPECGASCFTKMKVTDIPHFKEVIIMATDCDKCGSRTNEVKSGGGIEPKGRKMTLKVKSKEDFSRDVLKSDTCSVEIPELDLVAGGGAIVGKFTTIEGILVDIKKQFSEDNPMIGGDSVDPTLRKNMEKLVADLDLLLTGGKEFTIVLDDPAGNVYVQNVYAPEPDPELTLEDYERTFDQNEDLGLNDMNVEDQSKDQSK